MKAADIERFQSFPPSTQCRRIDFETAQIIGGIVPKTYFLIVSGKKPWASMEVDLVPMIYVDTPEFWGIEVIACESGIGLPVEVPYCEVLEVTNYLGKQGVEIIGASKSEKIKLS